MDKMITQMTQMAMQLTIWAITTSVQITINILKVLVPFLFKGTIAVSKAIADMVRQPRRVRDTHILVPGDRPPASFNEDHYDYRGIAKESQVSELHQSGVSGVSLGRYLHPDGKVGNQLSLANEQLYRGTVIIGASGSGKTHGIIEPWIVDILRSGGSVITVDIKGDAQHLQKIGQRLGVRVLYWNGCQPQGSLSWNFLEAIAEYRDIEAAVECILGRSKANDPNEFFHNRDVRWLRALIPLTKQVYGNNAKPCDLYRLVSDRDTLRAVFADNPQLEPDNVNDLCMFTYEEHSKAISGLLNALNLFLVPDTRAVTEHSDFEIADLGKQPTLLIIGAPLSFRKSSEVLSSIMLSQLITYVYRRLEVRGLGNVPLHFLIDEAARLKDRINYEEFLSTARSARTGITLALQDVTQLGTEREAQSVLANCQTAIVFAGCSHETANFLQDRLGQRKVQKVGVNRRDLELFGGRNQSSEDAAVLGDREIMHIPVGLYPAIVHARGISAKPILVELDRHS